MADMNTMVKWMLESPLHFFASKNLLLITVTGRRTGKQYTTPVRYYRDDRGNVVIFARRASVWWKNLQDRPNVTLRLKGRNVAGTVKQVVSDQTEVAKALKMRYPKRSESKLAQRSGNRVMLTIAI